MSAIFKKVLRTEIVSLACSKCGKVVTPTDFIGWQEFQTINFTGGYGSVFGDGQIIRIDLCQDCLFEFSKDFYEVEEKSDVEDM